MRDGKQNAQWDHTAALICHVRLAAGDKETDFRKYHPFYQDAFKAAQNAKARAAFRKLGQQFRSGKQ